MVAAAVAAAMAVGSAGKGSTYSHWRQFGANNSDASSECSNIRVECLASKHKSICAQIDF